MVEIIGHKAADTQEMIRLVQEVFSLDAPLIARSSDPITIAETLADPRAVEGLETIEEDASYLTVQQVLRVLSYQERQILILRPSLNGQEPLTLREVGKVLGLSGEGVRLIEMRALRTLRQSAQGHQFWESLRGEAVPLPSSNK